MTTPFETKAKQYFNDFSSTFCLVCNYLGTVALWFAIFLFTANIMISLVDVFSLRGSQIVIVLLILSYLKRPFKIGLATSVLQIVLFFIASLAEHVMSTVAAIKFSCVFIFASVLLLIASITNRGLSLSLYNLTKLAYWSSQMLVASLAFRFDILHDIYIRIFEPQASDVEEKNHARVEENQEDTPEA